MAGPCECLPEERANRACSSWLAGLRAAPADQGRTTEGITATLPRPTCRTNGSDCGHWVPNPNNSANRYDFCGVIQSPFQGIDLNDAQAVAAAHKKAIELGEPLSEELKRFCKKNGLEAYPRLVDVHKSLHFIVDLPNRRRVLQ